MFGTFVLAHALRDREDFAMALLAIVGKFLQQRGSVLLIPLGIIFTQVCLQGVKLKHGLDGLHSGTGSTDIFI